MTTSTVTAGQQAIGTAEPDPFDLDIRVLEFSDAAATLIDLTDDNCGSTCPKACVTAMG